MSSLQQTDRETRQTRQTNKWTECFIHRQTNQQTHNCQTDKCADRQWINRQTHGQTDCTLGKHNQKADTHEPWAWKQLHGEMQKATKKYAKRYRYRTQMQMTHKTTSRQTDNKQTDGHLGCQPDEGCSLMLFSLQLSSNEAWYYTYCTATCLRLWLTVQFTQGTTHVTVEHH